MRKINRPIRAGRPLLLLFCVLLGAAGGLIVAERSTERYSARAVAVVVPRGGAATDATLANYARAYGRIATDPAVLGPAIAKQNLTMTTNQAARSLTVSVAPTGSIIEVSAERTRPTDAARLANAAVAGLIEYTNRQQGSTRVQVVGLLTAATPTTPVSPSERLNTLIGAGLGLVTGALLLVLASLRTPQPAPRREPAIDQPDDTQVSGPPEALPLASVATTANGQVRGAYRER